MKEINGKMEVIYGFRPIIEGLAAGKNFQRIFVLKNTKSNLLKELRGLADKNDVAIRYVDESKFGFLQNANHQGVFAESSPVEFKQIEHILPLVYEQGRVPFFIILDRVTDVRNFGAIVRTAECCRADAVIIPNKSSARINAEAFKTSAGALQHFPIVRTNSISNTIEYLQQSGVKVFACTEKAEKTIYTSDLKVPLALIFGSEEDGIRLTFQKASDEIVKLPILGEIQSLNVSVAAGICMYELVRQRHYIK